MEGGEGCGMVFTAWKGWEELVGGDVAEIEPVFRFCRICETVSV